VEYQRPIREWTLSSLGRQLSAPLGAPAVFGPVRLSRIAYRVSRIAYRVSRIAYRVSRIAYRVSPIAYRLSLIDYRESQSAICYYYFATAILEGNPTPH
jgi:hypothetical protein